MGRREGSTTLLLLGAPGSTPALDGGPARSSLWRALRAFAANLPAGSTLRVAVYQMTPLGALRLLGEAGGDGASLPVARAAARAAIETGKPARHARDAEAAPSAAVGIPTRTRSLRLAVVASRRGEALTGSEEHVVAGLVRRVECALAPAADTTPA